MNTLLYDTVITCETAAKWAEDLRRCDREIAAARKALLTRCPDALLWYTDSCLERDLLLLASSRD